MRSPRRLLATVLGTVLLTVAALPVGAGAATTPVVKVRPVVSGFSVTVGYSIDRPASAIAKQICWLRDPKRVLTKVACDKTPEPSSTATLTRFRRTLPVTKAGTNAFLVRFTLTNGKQVLGGRSFTIEPGPAVRFSVTGLFNQTVRCDSKLCPGDWVNDVARQIAKVTARDEHGNRATGYTGTVVFDGAATTVSESKLKRGVGFFAVKPTGLELNQFSGCRSGLPADQDYKALTVTDKAQPSIRGCQVIFYDIFFVLDPLPIFRIPIITPDGCTTGCLEDPTETVIINTEAQPLQILQVETIELPQQDLVSSVRIVGETSEGQGFTQELKVENPEVKSSDLPPAVTERCTGCATPGTFIAVEIPADFFTLDTAPEVEAPAGGGELTIGGVTPIFPGINFDGFVPVNATNSGASEPICYKTYTAALVNVTDGVVPCQ